MDELGLIDSSRDFPSIRVINFIINLYLILLISVVKIDKKNSRTNQTLIAPTAAAACSCSPAERSPFKCARRRLFVQSSRALLLLLLSLSLPLSGYPPTWGRLARLVERAVPVGDLPLRLRCYLQVILPLSSLELVALGS